jgi:class 3 adenylate cyclase
MHAMTDSLPLGTVTFLFTDIEGSTSLVRKLGPEYGPLRSEHRKVLREAFAQHGGHEIDTAGDGFFVVFERAGDAVNAAVEAQRGLAGAPVRVRMGLHSAEPHLDDEGYTGVGVHRAERICSAGHGGQILLSNATAGIVEDLDRSGISLVDLGEHRLKGMERRQRVFEVRVDGLPAEFPPLRSLDAGPAVVTLLVSDLADFRRLFRELGDTRTAALVRAYHRLATEVVEHEDGRIVEAIADTVVALFDRPSSALRAAMGLRERLRTEDWSGLDEPSAARIGIHSGWMRDQASHSGLVVLQCLQLTNQAEVGQILVSHATEALLEAEPLDITLRGVGERMLPELEHPVNVFEIAG